jgi:hypothetical protein
VCVSKSQFLFLVHASQHLAPRTCGKTTCSL